MGIYNNSLNINGKNKGNYNLGVKLNAGITTKVNENYYLVGGIGYRDNEFGIELKDKDEKVDNINANLSGFELKFGFNYKM